MKRLLLIACLALGQGLVAAVSVLPLQPLTVVTPIMPPTVVAGQMATAQFRIVCTGCSNIYGKAYAWAFGLGTDVPADAGENPGWSWVADQDGIYGVTKATMAVACPTPGILAVATPSGNYDDYHVTFLVPDLGKTVPTTMYLHIMAAEGHLGGCADGGSGTQAMFVMNPAWTPSVTPTPTRTVTVNLTPATPTRTATRTATPGTPPTTVPTAVPTQGPISSDPTILNLWAYPNPNPVKFVVKISGVADELEIMLFSASGSKILSAMVPGPLTGVAHATISLKGLSNGLYTVKAFVRKAGRETGHKLCYAYVSQ